MSKDCKDTLRTQNSNEDGIATRLVSRVSVRRGRRQSRQDQESFRQTVPSSADA